MNHLKLKQQTTRLALTALALVYPAVFLWADSPSGDPQINGKPVPEIVASVNGVAVHRESLLGEVFAFQKMPQNRGKEFSQKEQEEMARHLLGKIIDQELIFQKALEMNIRISPAKIQKEAERIREMFPSEKLYLHALRLQHLTPESLEKRIEKQLAEEAFLRREFAPKTQVGEDRVEAYYKENQASFMHPETVHISHIFVATLNPDTQGKAEDPQDRKKADRLIKWVNQQAREKIEQVAGELQSGGNFAELAEKYSEDDATKNKGGNLGEMPLKGAPQEFADAIKKLKPGEFSGIIESAYGYHIIKLDGITPSRVIPFKEVKSDILNFLLKQELEKMKQDYLSGLRKKADIKIFL